ncbi:MAG: hypothetical protein WCV84_04045 [Patescibacteria group bacterium]
MLLSPITWSGSLSSARLNPRGASADPRLGQADPVGAASAPASHFPHDLGVDREHDECTERSRDSRPTAERPEGDRAAAQLHEHRGRKPDQEALHEDEQDLVE